MKLPFHALLLLGWSVSAIILRGAGGPGGPPPAAAAPAQPPPDEVRKLNELKLIWQDGEDTLEGSAQRQEFRSEYLKESSALLEKYPRHPEIWLLRAKAALELDWELPGWEAGKKLMAFGLDRSTDRDVQRLFAELERKHWLGEDSPGTGRRLPAGPPPPANLAGKNLTAGSAKIALQWIPAGTFRMGDPGNAPFMTVHLTRGFWLGKDEVTQGQWEALMGGNPSHFKKQGKNAPVEQISWDEAMDFCRRLNARERAAGRVPAGYEYRLPTEAEWEYACRAGATGDGGEGVLDDLGWYADNSKNHTHPVGRKRPNAWGLYDMHGNVWEWCLDWFGPFPGGEATDPAGPESGPSHVFRGGSWASAAEDCRAASRFTLTPGYVFFLGLRVALGPSR